MKKLRLDVTRLEVDGFQVQPASDPARGTVQGRNDVDLAITEATNCMQITCWNGSCGTGYPICRQCP